MAAFTSGDVATQALDLLRTLLATLNGAPPSAATAEADERIRLLTDLLVEAGGKSSLLDDWIGRAVSR